MTTTKRAGTVPPASGLEPFHRPAVSRPRVQLAFVHPVFPAEPEFDRLRRDAITAPVGGAGDFVALEPLLDLLELPRKLGRGFDLPGLLGCPGSQPMPDWPRLEVRVGFLGIDPVERTLHPDLHLQARPVERHRGLGVRLHFRRLPALIVGEEHEAPGVNPFQQNHAQRGPAVHGRGCEGDHGRVIRLVLLRLVEELQETVQRFVQRGNACGHAASISHLPPRRA